MSALNNLLARSGRRTVTGVPDGFDAHALAKLVAKGGADGILFIARDEERMQRVREALSFYAPSVSPVLFPAWDCLPYDRVSPHPDAVSRRIDTLTRLADAGPAKQPKLILTTVNAALQRVPPREALKGVRFHAEVGGRLDMTALTAFLTENGYSRTDTVMEAGEYAVRGGIVDLFPPGIDDPLRIDLFGDEVEGIRIFDALSQRTTGKSRSIDLKPVSEVFLDEPSIERFRAGYRALFGAVAGEDPLYEAISAGRRHAGMEHWLALFHERLETLFDYVPSAAVVLDKRLDEARESRTEMIAEHYSSRRSLEGADVAGGGGSYRPVPPERLYLDPDDWEALLAERAVVAFSEMDAAPESTDVVDAGGRRIIDFADVRAQPDANVYEAVGERVSRAKREGKRVLVAAYSAGSRDRLGMLLDEHGVGPVIPVESWKQVAGQSPEIVGLVVLELEHGYAAADHLIIAEQDILGERLGRRSRNRRRSEHFLTEATQLSEGDLVVHVEHGIGRYDELETLSVGGAPHDCLRVVYHGGDKLFVPVENIEVLSRFGSDEGNTQLDRLGGVQWQARKARLKKRIREMADQLITIAAQRTLNAAEIFQPPEGAYDEFCARFPYAETEDQLRAIEDVIDDLSTGRPMDRLICGDVGFGKTEVALRAAFIAVMAGMQVAVVVPTTLLARQHYQTFRDRFSGLPVRIGQLSRMVPGKEASQVKAGLTDGTIDIAIGTHAVLAKSVSIMRLGLLIVDEEQHFGVAHKERLKQLRADVHVLTLSATPIPRTLQLALSGVRELSLIATPPVDRLAVRTFVTPYDPLTVREAIVRERFRGGQTFYVCPRVSDLADVANEVRKLVPDVKLAIAHGGMASSDLEEVMSAFYDRKFDVLISTNIVESGLDIPTANTLIVHRADMFGLSQLYQLRGRIGRGKVRAYAYLTLPSRRVPTKAAEKRLHIMQALDSLGAGFTLASHDLDIRGAGNLLGDEQSGHIKEVGIELYQQMLEDAVAEAKAGGIEKETEDTWSPQINIGTPVLIPDTYVSELGIRLGLYRRIAALEDREEIDSLAAELIDRFGSLPDEVSNLLDIVAIKRMCRAAGVDRVDAGPKGAVIGFHKDSFANPAGLVDYINRQNGTAKVRRDQKLVMQRVWETPKARLEGVQKLLKSLHGIATEGERAPSVEPGRKAAAR